MKNINLFFLLTGILLIGFTGPVPAQRYMKMDQNLKGNSTPLKKKQMKFISSTYKYQFGSYKVISHKQGHGSRKSRKYYIHSSLEIDSLKTLSEHSMVFVNAGTDTAEVNTSVYENTVLPVCKVLKFFA